MTSASHAEPTVSDPARAGGPAAMPSLDLLRSLTDEHVLRAVMEHGRLTRASRVAHGGFGVAGRGHARSLVRSLA